MVILAPAATRWHFPAAADPPAGEQGNLRRVYEREEAEAMSLAREYMLDTGTMLRGKTATAETSSTRLVE